MIRHLDHRGRTVPVLFATLDPDLPRHTLASLVAAYASAAALDLDFVWPSLPGRSGAYVVALGRRKLSVTGWLDGARPEKSAADLPDLLARLHAAPPPAAVGRTARSCGARDRRRAPRAGGRLAPDER